MKPYKRRLLERAAFRTWGKEISLQTESHALFIAALRSSAREVAGDVLALSEASCRERHEQLRSLLVVLKLKKAREAFRSRAAAARRKE